MGMHAAAFWSIPAVQGPDLHSGYKPMSCIMMCRPSLDSSVCLQMKPGLPLDSRWQVLSLSSVTQMLSQYVLLSDD